MTRAPKKPKPPRRPRNVQGGVKRATERIKECQKACEEHSLIYGDKTSDGMATGYAYAVEIPPRRNRGEAMMPCISLHQPWASLCVLPSLADASIPVKPYETRSFPCPQKYIGKRILIHAAKKWGMKLYIMSSREPFASALRLGGMMAPRPKLANWLSSLPFGCIVGAVDVVECHEVVVSSAGLIMESCGRGRKSGLRFWTYFPLPTGDALAFGDFSLGRFAWALRNPVMFKTPIPYKGMQGFFSVPDDVVSSQIKEAV